MKKPLPPSQQHARRMQQLAETRQRILAMPPDKALSAILDQPQPAALVHAFAEEELHFLIHDIGVDDALPLLALASNRQWEYMLDMETWRKDRLDYPQATIWLKRLLRADPKRLIRWCFDEKSEFLELYLFRNIELYIRESDETTAEMKGDYFSDDDTYYVRPVDYPVNTPAEEREKSQRDALLGELLRRLSVADYPRYQALLTEAAGVIPAETEEELYRLRTVRLAEKGFLPFHEAIGVYQPLRPGDLAARGKKVLGMREPESGQLPAPSLAAAFLDGDNLFVRGLKSIDDPVVLVQLQGELAGLCNQVITADRQTIHGRDQLGAVVAKVSGYLSIGLERTADKRPTHRDTSAAALLRRHPLADLFRIGVAGALDLHWQATRWRKASWCQSRKIALTFWDEAWLGLLGGLLIDRPQYFDPAMADTRYRDFRTLAEIEATARGLKQIMALDDLCLAMQIPSAPLAGIRFLTYKNLLLTLWARTWLKLPAITAETAGIAIALTDFKPFYRWLWHEQGERRTIGDPQKSEFLQWLAAAADEAPSDLGDRLGTVFEALFSELQQELGAVRCGNLDPHYVQLFLLNA